MLWPQSTYIGTSLRPKYILFGYMDPSGLGHCDLCKTLAGLKLFFVFSCRFLDVQVLQGYIIFLKHSRIQVGIVLGGLRTPKTLLFDTVWVCIRMTLSGTGKH